MAEAENPLPAPSRLAGSGPERVLSQRDGVKVTWKYDALEGCYVIKTEEDIAPVVDANRRAQADTNGKPKGDFWHAGRIPPSVILQWRQEGIDVFNRDHWPAVRRKLNDIDNAGLRVAGRFRV